jgi:hypothetical protein
MSAKMTKVRKPREALSEGYSPNRTAVCQPLIVPSNAETSALPYRPYSCLCRISVAGPDSDSTMVNHYMPSGQLLGCRSFILQGGV